MVFNKLKPITCLVATLVMSGCAMQPDVPAVMVATPAPDGTACYGGDRVPFYQVSNTVLLVDEQIAQTRRTAQATAGLGILMTVAGLAAGGRAGQVLAVAGSLTAVAGALNANVQTDQRLIVDFSNAFNTLVQCRQMEAFQVRSDVRARRLRFEDGRERLRTLRDLMLEDASVAQQVNAALSRRNQTYLLAAGEVDTALARDPSARQQSGAEVVQARQTIQSSQRALTNQAAAIDKAAQTITVSSIAPPAVPT